MTQQMYMAFEFAVSGFLSLWTTKNVDAQKKAKQNI